MSVRLNKVMTTLNIGLDTVFDFLRGKPELGIVENLTLNSKITDEQYDALKKKYQKDGAIKKNASNVFSKISERKNKKIKENDVSGLKILGKIDLDSLNQKTRPARKSKAEREEERAKTKEQQKKRKNEDKVEVPLPSLKFTRHLIYYKGIDGIYTLTDKGISSAFNKFKSRFYNTIVEICLNREKNSFTFSNPSILNQIINICQNKEKEQNAEREKAKQQRVNAINTILLKTQDVKPSQMERPLSLALSEIRFQGSLAVIMYNGIKYSSFITKSERRALESLSRDLKLPLLLNTAKGIFKFLVSLNNLVEQGQSSKPPVAPKSEKELKTILRIENVEFHDHYYLIWIIRQGKKDTSITPLRIADNNSLPCLRLIHKYFADRFPKGIDIIYDSQHVIGLTQAYTLGSYIKVLNSNIEEHGEWWEEIQNDRKPTLAVCRKTPPSLIRREVSLRNCYLDYLAGMSNQETAIKVYEVRQNQQEDVFIFTVNIDIGCHVIIFENVSFTSTATWVFIVRKENYEECISRIFDYFTNYELHNKRQSLIKSLNPPQKFKAEDYYKIMHDEPRGWIKRLNDILVREIPSNRIQFNQGLHIAEETDSRSGSSDNIKVQHLHNELMRKLYYQLCQQFGEENVGTENHIGTKKIDVVARTESGYNIYEIKTDKEPRGCLREAMGQILDYAFFECEDNINKMVIVGVTPETKEVNTYLAKFREKNALEIYYTAV